MNPCILIIDDDHGTRVALRELLEDKGFFICSATNGKSGFEILHQRFNDNASSLPQLIILDLFMPIMNGWDFLTILRSEIAFANIPVIVTSVLTPNCALDEAQEFLQKPFDIEALLSKISMFTTV